MQLEPLYCAICSVLRDRSGAAHWRVGQQIKHEAASVEIVLEIKMTVLNRL
jgi:hypothetical protein